MPTELCPLAETTGVFYPKNSGKTSVGWICYHIGMKQQKLLLKVVYGYISAAFTAIVIDTFGFFHPVPDILAAVWLLVACFYIGKYGKLK
jgi:hypothetical protein